MKPSLLNKIFAMAIVVCLPFAAIGQTVITVDASEVKNNISPYLYGSGIEDVNHEIYGGLYDQRIFGESFEEPALNGGVKDFFVVDGKWTRYGDVMHADSYGGAKVVYTPVELENGTIEVELKFDNYGNNDNNAGILVRTTNPAPGADSFNGYEIALTGEGERVLFARHQYDYSFLADNSNVSVNPTEWNKMKVVLNGNNIKVYINDMEYLNHTNSAISGAGRVTLRNWWIGVSYRNLKITPKDGTTVNVAIEEDTEGAVSRMWDAIASEAASVKFKIVDDAYNTAKAQEVNFESGTGFAGVTNRSLNKWGIAVKKNQKFQGSLFLKGNVTSNVKVALQSVDGATEYAFQEIDAITANWEKYEFELTSNTEDDNARFAIYIDKPGTFIVDMVTLMGTGSDQFHELPLRADIGQAMVDQGLTFLRYGGSMVNADDYFFKNMIGPSEDRPIYKGWWYDYSTNGFGIEEFLQYCEAAGFEASFAVSVKESPQDMADMIEYLNGSVNTEWGKKRAENGHSKPYNFKYLQIGNEEVIWANSTADYQTYINQFNAIYEAVKAKDPNVVFIHSAWWRTESEALNNMKMVFDALDGKAEYWDYHPWAQEIGDGKAVQAELEDMRAKFLQWNPNTTMKCALFEENGNTHDMQRALSHAIIQNAARRMGDFMLATCAANALEPYLQNDNGWNQGQVFFTPSQVWGMPPYYAQQMASKNHKPYRVESQGPTTLDVVAATDDNCEEVILYVVNSNSYSIRTKVNVENTGKRLGVKTYTLSGALGAINTPETPTFISPVEKTLESIDEIEYSFPAYSYTIMVFKNEKKTSNIGVNKIHADLYTIFTDKKKVNIKSYSDIATDYNITSLSGMTVANGELAANAGVSESCESGVYLVALNTAVGKKIYKVLVQ